MNDPTTNQLIDKFGRQVNYLRLSVTDRCDLRCLYCLPQDHKDFVEPENWLTFDEITRVVNAFAALGVYRLRITGGEPLTRKSLPLLINQLSMIKDIEDISLSTNAVQLTQQAAALKTAGVKRLNVSLDSLDEARFKQMTRGRLDKVLSGLQAAKQAGFMPIKINMVVLQDHNDHEVYDMVEYCIENDFTLRFIEAMPMGDTGRQASAHYIALDVIRQRLEQRYELIPAVMSGGGPARYVQVAGSRLKIGFITPISQHFCETCNRVRLSAEGYLYLCLGQEHRMDLRTPLRQGVSDEALQQLIRDAIELKPQRHEFREKPGQLVRFMSMTGG